MTPSEARAVLAEVARRGLAPKQRWCPHEPTPKQAEFLALDCLEAMYGGAAGGGKSDALLMDQLLDADKPDFAGLILRRTFSDLALPGAIMDRSHEWLRGTPAHWSGDTKTWTFPSGATITFAYLEHENDKYRYQSAEFQAIALDELTQFSEPQYTYMLSRLRRRAGSKIRLRQRSGSNPGNAGHHWVKRRFVDPATRGDRAFVPARLKDNPHIDQAEYEKALDRLDEITRMQLKDGLWVIDTGGMVYKYNPDRNLALALPKHDMPTGRPIEWRYIWILDLGSSEKTPTESIAVLAFALDQTTTYVVESTKRASRTLDEIHDQYEADKLTYGAFHRVLVDQGGLGSKFSKELVTRYHMPVYPCDKANKLGYRKLLNGDLEKGHLLIVDGKNDDLIDEYNTLTWNDKGTDCLEGQADHASDAVLYGWREALHYRAKPNETPPPLGSEAHFARVEKEMRERRAAQVKEHNNPRPTVPWLKARRR